MTILKIAWRNIWRQRTRSSVIMLAIIVGLWGLIFLIGFMGGFIETYLENGIKYEYSHMQVHHPKFKKDNEPKFVIEDGLSLANKIRLQPNVTSVTSRTVINGMVSSSSNSFGVKVLGVDTLNEKAVTSFDQLVEEGSYFSAIKRNPVLIGTKLADRLKVKMRSKIVITFQNHEGEIASAAFRIAGIFNAKSPALNEGTILVKMDDLSRNLNGAVLVHEIAILLEDETLIDENIEAIGTLSSEIETASWKELAPELSLVVEQSGMNIMVMVIIFMVALIFGIINTMLMAVLERVKELGMLMAIGMTRLRVFLMIVFETFFLGMAATPIGLLAGYLTIHYLSTNGIDLSSYSEGLDAFGYDNFIYPVIKPDKYIMLSMGIFITTLLAAIYPAIKAVRLKPVEAIRKI